MMVEEIGKIGVVGAGTMGQGIAQVSAQHGFDVVMRDIEKDLLERALKSIEANLSREVKKGDISEEKKEETLERIYPTLDSQDFQTCDIVIEAAVEDLEIKKEVFRELEEVCDPDTIFATNTSSLSITELASVTGRAEKFIGMHFFNPVPLIDLVEVIRGHSTDDKTKKVISSLAEELDKEPIEVKDSPGFAVNRMIIPMINEAVCVLNEGVASKEDIDKMMRLGANHPMGPLELADMIGVDVVLDIMETLEEELNESKYKPSPLLEKMVREGKLGRKSGEGFYDYR